MSKGIVIFLEGDTEEAFYSKIIEQLHSYAPDGKFKTDKLLIKNLRGIGNYKKKVKRIFVNEILPSNPNTDFIVVLCYDTDVFELSAKPPVIWSDVDKTLMEIGAKKVIHIKSKHSIEDWFLFDKEGLLRYLKLPTKTIIPTGSGIKIIQTLFKKADKVYIKGLHAKGFIDNLNVKIIMSIICRELKNLCNELGIQCMNKKC